MFICKSPRDLLSYLVYNLYNMYDAVDINNYRFKGNTFIKLYSIRYNILLFVYVWRCLSVMVVLGYK